MSTVYKAFDTVLERPVAIKLMHREIATDSDQLERFRREARAVAQLNHPHVVSVIDAGEEPLADDEGGRTPYIVLEYVDGETLKSMIRRDGPLEIPQALRLRDRDRARARRRPRTPDRPPRRQAAEHPDRPRRRREDHRLRHRALALRGGADDGGRVLGTTTRLTRAGPRTGGDAAVGLYSLGIVLYEMLTGDVPSTARRRSRSR